MVVLVVVLLVLVVLVVLLLLLLLLPCSPSCCLCCGCCRCLAFLVLLLLVAAPHVLTPTFLLQGKWCSETTVLVSPALSFQAKGIENRKVWLPGSACCIKREVSEDKGNARGGRPVVRAFADEKKSAGVVDAKPI